MSNIIAVWGSNESGKTLVATKLATQIYDHFSAKKRIVVVYADYDVPVLPYLLPNYRVEDLFSIGKELSKSDVIPESLIKSFVTVKERENFAVLGFTDGENRYSYPEFDEDRARALFDSLAVLADYVVVDCTGNLDNVISCVAVKTADFVLRLATPDLKSLAWLESNLNLYVDPMYRLSRQIQCLNVPDYDLYMPIQETQARIGTVKYILPFSKEVKQQALDGKLIFPSKDAAFRSEIKKIADDILEEFKNSEQESEPKSDTYEDSYGDMDLLSGGENDFGTQFGFGSFASEYEVDEDGNGN